MDDKMRAALLLAQSLAFRCVGNFVDDQAVARVVIAANEGLGPAHQVTELVRQIGRNWRGLKGSPEALSRHGQELLRQVERAMWPGPDMRLPEG